MRRRELLGLALACLAAPGCDSLLPGSKTPFNGVAITGSDLGPDFRLKDHNGKERTLADFRVKVVALFFGYSHCPDVCPTTLSDMAKALQILGPDAPRVQVLFVTLDPKRDTPELLREYVPCWQGKHCAWRYFYNKISPCHNVQSTTPSSSAAGLTAWQPPLHWRGAACAC